ncbi:MAG TPA: DUF2905 family protein [Oculatellaceae cyanobacterium]
METSLLGRGLIVIGLLVAGLGLLFVLMPKMPFLGRLPGDIMIDAGNVKIFAPLATCLIISLILTILVNLFSGRK